MSEEDHVNLLDIILLQCFNWPTCIYNINDFGKPSFKCM